MDIDHALVAFSALSQETRLRVFKMLVPYGQTGAPAGTLSEGLSIPHNTLSFHLSHLSHAGLVTARRQGRSVIYSANCDTIQGLISFLLENCCTLESPDDKTASSVSCCPPKPKKKGT